MFFFVFNVYCFAILDTGWLCSKEKSKYSSFTVPFFHTHCGVEELTPDGLKLFFFVLFYCEWNRTFEWLRQLRHFFAEAPFDRDYSFRSRWICEIWFWCVLFCLAQALLGCMKRTETVNSYPQVKFKFKVPNPSCLHACSAGFICCVWHHS